MRHVEWFADHARLEQRLFEGAPRPCGGELAPTPAPGLGLALREAEAAALRVYGRRL